MEEPVKLQFPLTAGPTHARPFAVPKLLKRREAAVPSLGDGEGRVAGRRHAVPEHEVLSSDVCLS